MVLIGTKWNFVQKTDLETTVIEFLNDGVLIYPPCNINTWKKEGNKITMEINDKYVLHEGIIENDKITGSSQNIKGKKWTFVATMIQSDNILTDNLNQLYTNKDIDILVNEYVPNFYNICRLLTDNKINYKSYQASYKDTPGKPNSYDIHFGFNVNFQNLYILIKTLKNTGIRLIFYSKDRDKKVVIGSHITDCDYQQELSEGLSPESILKVPFSLSTVQVINDYYGKNIEEIKNEKSNNSSIFKKEIDNALNVGIKSIDTMNKPTPQILIDISYSYTFLSGAWHLAYYIPSNRPIGSLSDNILKFKSNISRYVNSWIKWATDGFQERNLQFDYVIRALGSSELKVIRSKGLDTLGIEMSKSLNALYIPEILEKNRTTVQMHTLHSRLERSEAIRGSYFVANKSYNLNNKRILILDDVSTTSTTIKEIIRALKEVWPNGKYFLFCLGKTNHEENANDDISQAYFN